jgi:hypothetical protein
MPVRVVESSAPSQVSGISLSFKNNCNRIMFIARFRASFVAWKIQEIYLKFTACPRQKGFVLFCFVLFAGLIYYMFILNCEGANSGETLPQICSLLSVGQVNLRPFLFLLGFLL